MALPIKNLPIAALTKKPGWLGDFQAFIMRGNVVDLAVGIIIGAAFTGIVQSLVKDVFNPIIGLLTGHKSRELRRYQHLREELKRKTVDLIAGVLKDAEKNGKGTSSSRLLHGARKR